MPDTKTIEENIKGKLHDSGPVIFWVDSQTTDMKSKTGQMELHQTIKLPYRDGN